MTECPACHGERIREWRCYAAGASPYDASVKCDWCYELGQCSEREAEQWRRFPTVPDMPQTDAQKMRGAA